MDKKLPPAHEFNHFIAIKNIVNLVLTQALPSGAADIAARPGHWVILPLMRGNGLKACCYSPLSQNL